MVSRRHCAIEWTDAGLLATDLDSTNGTFVNNAAVKSAYIRDKDIVRIGETALQAVLRPTEIGTRELVRSFGRLASSSPRMLRVLALCEELAKSDVSIIIEGETGTGKELLAECLHEASDRADGPFMVLDCRTIPQDLVEVTLFGEARRDDGAFRPGIFDLAAGGTLLIDEPGALDANVQTKLLRVLDKKCIVHVGDVAPTPIDTRIIVATTQNLDKMVEGGQFREDLYYRLAGARLEVPPLRRRREDIPALASTLWSELGGKGTLPNEMLERFGDYDWPGNVRELGRAIERFLALGDKVSLHFNRAPQHRPQNDPATPAVAGDFIKELVTSDLPYPEARRRVLEEFQRVYLEKALATTGGNVAAAAARSGIARRYFQRIRARHK